MRLLGASVSLGVSSLCVLSDLPSRGWAQAVVPPAPQQARPYSRVAPILPTAQISASTSGKADFKASADIVVGTEQYDWAFTPTLLTSSQDGISTLFSVKNGTAAGPASWRAGLGISLSHVPQLPALPIEQEQSGLINGSKREAFDQCMVRCGIPAAVSLPEDIAFCGKYGPHATPPPALPIDPTAISEGKFCPVGNAYLKEAVDKVLNKKYDKKRRDQVGEYPLWDASVGAAVGSSQFKYLDTTQMPYSDTTKSHLISSYAAVFTHVSSSPDLAFTLEIPVILTESYKAQDKTAHWCTPQESVLRPDGSGISDAAEICTDRALGSPDKQTQLTASGLFGGITKPKANWRLSAGPVASHTFATSARTTLGIQAPMYLSFVNVTSDEYAGEYKGVLRLTPSLVFVRRNGSWNTQAFLTLEILGKRSLFSRALDWL